MNLLKLFLTREDVRYWFLEKDFALVSICACVGFLFKGRYEINKLNRNKHDEFIKQSPVHFLDCNLCRTVASGDKFFLF